MTLGCGLGLLLLSGFSLIAGLLGVCIGFAIPYMFLALKRNRRRAAFYAALPDTLQMVAGSLAAGHSLPQAFDAVVKETDGPMSDELGRALVAARLGADFEDALEAVARRMECEDLAWVVMAIRIQHDVGGNLSEILMTVSTTLRERERLRRQVQVLSAEGRISAVILGSLPVAFAVYLSIVRPDYLGQLFDSAFGIALVAVGVGLFIGGAFWLRATVKVEV